jgi:hypothetical protein
LMNIFYFFLQECSTEKYKKIKKIGLLKFRKSQY